jgi:hypothetical protein
MSVEKNEDYKECSICGQEFETKYNTEEDLWMYSGATIIPDG